MDDNMEAPERTLTVAEAAQRLGRSIEQVRRYLREGKLRGRRIGGQWFIEEASLGTLYRPTAGRVQRVREPAAIMESKVVSKDEMEKICKRIDERFDTIRKRLSGDIEIDVVAMLREDREEH